LGVLTCKTSKPNKQTNKQNLTSIPVFYVLIVEILVTTGDGKKREKQTANQKIENFSRTQDAFHGYYTLKILYKFVRRWILSKEGCGRVLLRV